IHIDKKCKEETAVLSGCHNLTICREHYDVRWGEISMVDAVLTMCREALTRFDAGHYVLLSGNDYPVKTADYIESFLSKNQQYSFLTGERLPSARLPWLEGGRRHLKAYALPLGKNRIATIEPRRFDIGNIRQFIKTALFCPRLLSKAVNLLIHSSVRTAPMPIFGGDFWWIISRNTLLEIIRYNDSHPALHKFMTDVANADEVYFPTMAFTVSPDTIVKKRMRHISWSKKGNSPRWLTMENYKEIETAVTDPESLFIRKVDSTEVCDFIDSLVAETETI
ncbi:MAG: beta-1,6-N-acetylglucosaminyltransferase, partial [Muribaculum sp.]|nr:beta-1,6-N-acetylglucosaminyltransferase [Muribaculum sp.]